MKNIKKFESFDKGYEEIEYLDYVAFLKKDMRNVPDFDIKQKSGRSFSNLLSATIPFSEAEIKEILQQFDFFKIIKPEHGVYNYFKYENKESKDIDSIFIRKLPDEWYIVHIDLNSSDMIFYKCDQLYGLIQCIKDNVIKYV